MYNNNSSLRVVFSTLFSAFENVVKHGLASFMYYVTTLPCGILGFVIQWTSETQIRSKGNVLASTVPQKCEADGLTERENRGNNLVIDYLCFFIPLNVLKLLLLLTSKFCIILLQSKYSCHYGCADGLECRRSGPPSPPGGKPRHPHPHHHSKCVRPTPPTEEPGSGDMDEFWTWISHWNVGGFWDCWCWSFEWRFKLSTSSIKIELIQCVRILWFEQKLNQCDDNDGGSITINRHTNPCSETLKSRFFMESDDTKTRWCQDKNKTKIKWKLSALLSISTLFLPTLSQKRPLPSLTAWLTLPIECVCALSRNKK